MKIAIIGTGLAGLAVGWHLLQEGCSITFFNNCEQGYGASGVAAGLMHPYAGNKALRSVEANEGLAHTEELIAVSEEALGRKVVVQRGLIRIVLNDEQRTNLRQADDAEEIGPDQFLIHSGSTVDVPSYLEGLFLACKKLGADHIRQSVSLDGPLEGFTHTVFACGNAFLSSRLAGRYPLKAMKGQVLMLKCSAPIERSRIAHGYLAATFDPHIVCLGATYERKFPDGGPCLEKAMEDLVPKISQLLPPGISWEIIDCRAGVRLIREGFYFPFAEKLDSNCSWIGALGFRGLLYHALLGKKLSCAIVRS